jgi:hypothetical protein
MCLVEMLSSPCSRYWDGLEQSRRPEVGIVPIRSRPNVTLERRTPCSGDSFVGRLDDDEPARGTRSRVSAGSDLPRRDRDPAGCSPALRFLKNEHAGPARRRCSLLDFELAGRHQLCPSPLHCPLTWAFTVGAIGLEPMTCWL